MLPNPMQSRQREARDKALAINLDPRRYGTFAEIGAGQEVVHVRVSADGLTRVADPDGGLPSVVRRTSHCHVERADRTQGQVIIAHQPNFDAMLARRELVEAELRGGRGDDESVVDAIVQMALTVV